MSGVKRLFWDVECSPNVGLFWRAGYKQTIPHDNIIQERAIICICYKWQGQKQVQSLEWDKGDDRAMLEAFMKVADQADEMIAHNGDKFDLKWFQTRCLFHDLDPPEERKTVDTLAIARRRFYFNSNRLDYIARFLGLGGKSGTTFDMWKAIVLDHDPKAMRDMVRYCKRDVLLLQQVWERIEKYHKPKTHHGVFSNREKWSCPGCASESVRKNKTRVTTAGTIRHDMHCKSCQRHYTIPDKAFRDYCEAKIGVAI